jgi:hypothetical protein
VYVSELQPDGIFGPPMLVSELSSPLGDNRLTIRHDGLEIIFSRIGPGP